jgi:hypothetical protein
VTAEIPNFGILYVKMSYAYGLEKENVGCIVNVAGAIAVMTVIHLFPIPPIL